MTNALCRRSWAAWVAVGLLLSIASNPASAKFKHFKRYYRNARTIRIRHGKRTLHIQPDHPRSTYRERQFLLLPNLHHSKVVTGVPRWNKRRIRSVSYLDRSRQVSPEGRAAASTGPREIAVHEEFLREWYDPRWTYPRDRIRHRTPRPRLPEHWRLPPGR